MSKQYDVCILGATGAVGEAMLSILEQRKFPVRNLYPLASSTPDEKYSLTNQLTIDYVIRQCDSEGDNCNTLLPT